MAAPPYPGAGVAVTRLFRVILPVPDIEAAAAFYARVLGTPGERVWESRHYFDCGGVLLACLDPRREGWDRDAVPNPELLYFAVDDLEAVHARAVQAGFAPREDGIATRAWGERSFYGHDPFGNPLCFVDAATVFTGGRPT
ncbi:VOC family protein [Longimicrobium sp.]|uniref:VOC family protein n=1 Tax=Longimicrobium sp. TaxID=2029185 RepID=UPI002E34E011|nr:VOC family protein [Longimicrobium sp.]HEX6042038.1 VOC family protein [Longimicrobium sp.]